MEENKEIKEIENLLEADISQESSGSLDISTSDTVSSVTLEHYQYVETSLNNLTIIGIMILLGIGLIFGGLACKSLFYFFR